MGTRRHAPTGESPDEVPPEVPPPEEDMFKTVSEAELKGLLPTPQQRRPK